MQDKEEIEGEFLTEEDEDERAPGFFDGVDFTRLYRVKGRPGLYTNLSKPNKSGMMGFHRVNDVKNRFTEHESKCVALFSYVFRTYAGYDDLYILTVFNNIHRFSGGINVELDPNDFNPELMAYAVPEFDEDVFKPRHFKLLIQWYNELTPVIDGFKIELEKSKNG